MPLDLGSLVGGFQGGMGSGYDLMAKRRALEEQARAQAAQRAIGQGQINAANGNAPGGMTNVPVPGAQPMPQAGGPPAAPPGLMPQGPARPPGPTFAGTPPGGPLAASVPGMGRGGPPPPGAMSAAPVSSPGATPAAAARPAAPPAFSGVAQPTGDLFQDSQQTVDRVFQELIKQNPALKSDPQTLFAAAEQQINLMKGVGSDVRNMMLMQTNAAKLSYQYDSLASRTAKWQQESLDRAERLEELSRDKSLDRAARMKIAELAASTRLQATAMTDQTREDVANIGASSRDYATDSANARTEATLGERGREADNREAGADYRTDVGATGADPKNPQARPQRRAFRPTQLPRRGQGGPAAAGGQPPYDPAKYPNHKVPGPGGSVWVSDGKTWKRIK